MIYVDERITNRNCDIFKEMIGKKLVSIMHDPFVYTNSVYGIAGLNIDHYFYKISNKTEVRDYFGAEEDVAVFNIMKTDKDNIHSYVEGVKMIEIPVNQLIKRIKVVNEHQQLYEQEQQIYDVWITRGFIIELADGLEVSFEKEIWFSEDINIERGYKLDDKFFPTSRVEEGWDFPKKMICTREMVEV